jgi:hypothetical protein
VAGEESPRGGEGIPPRSRLTSSGQTMIGMTIKPLHFHGHSGARRSRSSRWASGVFLRAQ